MEGGVRDDDEEEVAVGVGRAGGVSEARRACLAPALWSRARGDAEAVEGTDLGGVGGGKSGGAGEEEEERGVSRGAGRGASEFALRRAVCCVWVREAPCCARAAERGRRTRRACTCSGRRWAVREVTAGESPPLFCG